MADKQFVIIHEWDTKAGIRRQVMGPVPTRAKAMTIARSEEEFNGGRFFVAPFYSMEDWDEVAMPVTMVGNTQTNGR
jgi:hypothetical protein